MPKMGRLGEPQMNIKQHWVCKECETANHKTRLNCLSCGKERSLVQVKDKDHVKVWKSLGFDEDYILGITMSDKEITKDWVKTNFDNGEYP